MRIDQVTIYDFKNLKDFSINLDKEEMYTVLLGQNAAGKSNFLEALIILFRDLFLDNDPFFRYDIEYTCGRFNIKINAQKELLNRKNKYQFYITGISGKDRFAEERITRTEFYKRKNELLPKYLVAYYSGNNRRLEQYFSPFLRKAYEQIKSGEENTFLNLLYAVPIHSSFALMSFFSFDKKEKDTKEFLFNKFGIIELDSILIVVKRPDWVKESGRKLIERNELSFYGIKGSVGILLRELYELSLAPITELKDVSVDFRKKKKEELTYLYLSDQSKLKILASRYKNNIHFFRLLDSVRIAGFIHDVRIRVKKKDETGAITFKELSEGEQQLLTVLGLLRFTKSEESLILLDEPDTHLNPIWKWQYIKLLREIVDKPATTQIVMTSHDPLVIGSLRKEELRVFYQDEKSNEIIATEPYEDPQGKGIAAILTSDLFGLPSTLDEDSQLKLTRKRMLEVKRAEGNITSAEEEDLIDLEAKLEHRGVVYSVSDPLYQKFISATMKIPEFQQHPMTREERRKQDELALSILEKILAEEKND